MKHTATDQERMVLQVLQDTMLHAKLDQQQVYILVLLPTA